MEKTNWFSITSIILIRANSVFPLVGIVILFSILLHLYEIYSFLRCFIQNVLQILVIAFKRTSKSGNAIDTDADTVVEPCSDTKNVKPNLSRGEVEFVMDRMSIFLDPKGDNIEERIGSDEMSDMFDEGVSLEEVREAFGVFDENCDGFIDAEELEKVLNALGFREVTKGGCEKMIRVYDDNGDGLIDAREFVKVLETSFS